MKTIEVTGEAKRTVTPDEIIYHLNIQEYWEEEFQGKEYKDFKTKVPIDKIEIAVLEELKNLGVGMNQITLKQSGNNWRSRGKDVLVQKTLAISLPSFKKANELSTSLKSRGIQNMNVVRLKHKNEVAFQLEVKGEALKVAKEKATYLAGVLEKKVIDVISIVEVDQRTPLVMRPQKMAYARAAGSSMQSQGASYEQFKELELKALVRVVFEMA